MTLYDLIHKLKDIALRLPNVRTFAEGSVYDVMNGKNNIEYDCIVLSQDTHRADETFNYFTFNIFYISRLVSDMEENRLQVQSLGIEVLNNLFNILSDKYDIEIENNIQYNPFTQKFVDECCGVYASLVLNVPKEFLCAEQLFSDNSAPIISIKNVTISKEYTKNGDYSITYDKLNYTGIERVEVKVAVDYTDELNSAREEGYNNGLEVGKEEQKTLLQSITITENGTYNREDGYNEIVVEVPDLNGDYNTGYNEGYNAGDVEGYDRGKTDGYNEGYNIGYNEGEENGIANAGEIIAQTARVLDITENGTYVSQYSDPVIPDTITGVYPNGEKFYSYAQLNGAVYDTGVMGNQNTKLEFWWKPDTDVAMYRTILGFQVNAGMIMKICETYSANELKYEYGNAAGNTGSFTINDGWNYIIFSKADGLVVNGIKIVDLTADWYGDVYPNVFINASYREEIDYNANGYFGMIKITTDGITNVIIPTENGFKNVTTNQTLQILKVGVYNFTEELPVIPEGNLIKTVNVNIQPKININEIGFKLGYSPFKEIPEIFDFDGVIDMSNMFNNCGSLTSIPELNTSNVIDMSSMFSYCRSLTSIPALDTSNVTNMNNMFYYCQSLTSIPQLDTSNVTNMNQMFYYCRSLTSIPALQAGKLNKPSTYQGVIGSYELPNVTEFGGFQGLKVQLVGNYNLVRLPNLNYESCINVLNGLYDFTGNGETPNTDQGQLQVHQNFIDLVGDEINIAIQKGWQVFS